MECHWRAASGTATSLLATHRLESHKTMRRLFHQLIATEYYNKWKECVVGDKGGFFVWTEGFLGREGGTVDFAAGIRYTTLTWKW